MRAFKMWQILIFIISIFTAKADHSVYKGFKVYEIIPQNSHQVGILKELSEFPEIFDFWKLNKIENDSAHVMISPEYQEEFEIILNESETKYAIIDKDVGGTLEYEELSQNFIRLLSTSKVDFTRYYRFDEINQYLDELSTKYPARVKLTEVGKSYEGRSMRTITITNGDSNPGKKTIFVDAGIHAREWIAPATALYIINQLVENNTTNSDVLKNFNWIILPVVNPDGYEYTHTGQRFWRKTRSSNLQCAGTDGNRNFDFHWGAVGTSSDSCSDIYRGSEPFSELETQIVRNVLRAERGRCLFYLTLHSYGNYMLYPWGWTPDLPETWKDLDEVSQAGADAIKNKTGARYTVGSSTNVLYAAAGGSDDYAFGVEDVPIAMTMELPGRGFGFNPPSLLIKSIVGESWVGIKAMAKKVEEKYVQL